MKYLFPFFLFVCMMSCKHDKPFEYKDISKVEIERVLVDSSLNVRAIELVEEKILFGSSEYFGVEGLSSQFKIDVGNFRMGRDSINFKKQIFHEDKPLNFRAVAFNGTSMFALSIGTPARLYKYPELEYQPQLVYEETHPKAFYDSMDFWNDEEGIAIGDSTDGCLSVIITRDGGNTWNKLACKDLPVGIKNEGAFAASDTNIAIVGDKTWVATTAGRIYYSPDKGMTWEVFDTPIVKEKETEGIYSIDFYNELNGFGIGGDYTKPDDNQANKIMTKDGGKTWQVVGQGQEPGYRSCVQYIPNRAGKELVAVGFKGIDYSNDSGHTWKHLSDEGFYAIRFLNDSVAYAAGKGRISKLTFKK